MAGYSQTNIIGNVGRDPEMRFTPQGKAVTDFSVAVTRRYKDEDHTEWFTVTCWEKLAEVANNFLRKGKQVFVTGRVELEQFQRKDGTSGAKLKLTAQNLVLLGSKQDGAESPPAESAPEAPSFDNMPF